MEEKVFEFIKKFIEEHKYSPTVREICSGIGKGMRSTNSAFYYLKKLKEAKKIDYIEKLPRTITILGGTSQ